MKRFTAVFTLIVILVNIVQVKGQEIERNRQVPMETYERNIRLDEIKVRWKKQALDECFLVCDVTTSNTGEVKTISLEELIFEFELPEGFTEDPSEFGIELTDESGVTIFVAGELIVDTILQDSRIQGNFLKKTFKKVKSAVNFKSISNTIKNVGNKFIIKPTAKFGSKVWNGAKREVFKPIKENLPKINSLAVKLSVNGLTNWKLGVDIDFEGPAGIFKVKAVGYIVGDGKGVTFGAAVTDLSIFNTSVPENYLPKYEKSLTWTEVALDIWCAFPQNAPTPVCVAYYKYKYVSPYIDAANSKNPVKGLAKQAARDYIARSYIRDENNVVTYGSEYILTFPPPEVITKGFDVTGGSIFTLNGEIKYKDGYPLLKKGFVIATFPQPTLYNGIELAKDTLISSSNTIQPDQSFGNYIINFVSPPGTYYFRAFAIDGIDTIYGSSQTFTSTGPNTVPGAPTGVTATAGNASASVAFTAPTNNGGSAITGYTVTSSPGGITATGATSPINVTGLTNGTAYTFTVAATNSVGNSVASIASAAVTPVAPTVPGAPTGVTATAGNASASVAFTAPVSNGGSSITGYTVTSSPGGITATGATSPINVTGLTNGTAYTFTVVATNSVGNSVASSASAAVTPAAPSTCPTSSITDIDGNMYNTVAIGTQCWTKENLRVTKYNDGTDISLDNSGGNAGNDAGETWSSRTTGAYTIYAHSQANLSTYGYLYNWYAAAGIITTGGSPIKNICPTGWHVPSDTEWNTLTTFLGGQNLAGGKMKSIGTSLWRSPNTDATNESGFSGFPGGLRLNDARFVYLGSNEGGWWSTSEPTVNSASNANLRRLEYNNGEIKWNAYPKKSGFSVRCIRD